MISLTLCINNTITVTKSLNTTPADSTIYTEKDLHGLGTVFGKYEIGEIWTEQETYGQNNFLKFEGATLECFSFFKENVDIKLIRVMIDNDTVVAYIDCIGD